jgi:ankyrin repeat protein
MLVRHVKRRARDRTRKAATDHYGMTGLQWAESNGHLEIVELLTDSRTKQA